MHVSGALLVRHDVLRLVPTIDPETGAKDGPYVLLGARSHAVRGGRPDRRPDTARGRGAELVASQEPEGALTVLDPELAQHRRHVDTHRGGRQEQALGDRLGGQPLRRAAP